MTFQWLSEDYCCELVKQAEDEGWMPGSHYHCYECGKLCSMMGHLTSVHFVNVPGKPGKWKDVPQHYCCDKQNCEVV